MIIIVAAMAYVVASRMGSTPEPEKPEAVVEEKKPHPEVEEAPPVVTARVVVARQSIPARVMITADMLEMAEVEVSEIIDDGIRSIAGAVGKATMEPHLRGEQIHRSRLHEYAGRPGLALSIPNNTRAMTLRVDEISGVGSFIQQGDYVDVIALYTERDLDEPFATTITQNARVLAMGGELILRPGAVAEKDEGAASAATGPRAPAPGGQKPAERRPQGSEPSEGEESAETVIAPTAVRTVTLAVSLEDAERITVADSRASLRLVLRSPFNQEITQTRGAFSSDVTGYHKSRTLLNTERERQDLERMYLRGGPVEIFHGTSRHEGGSR